MQKQPKGTKLNALIKVGDIAQQIIDLNKEQQLRRIEFDRSIRTLNNQESRLKDELKMYSYLMKYGFFFVGVSSTDCDCVQSYNVYKFQSVKKFHKFCEYTAEGAEGQLSISLISKSDYDEERQHPTRSRDRIMEAYENGNGRSVVV